MINSGPESPKLLALREKTDRELVRIIRNRLELGFMYARRAAEAGPRGDWAATSEWEAAAEKAFDEVRALLPWVDDEAGAERHRLELNLEQLRELLNRSSIHAVLLTQTACS